ncbi:hypothetical protein MASR2M70_13650 [Bacillota bacterium]
MFRVRYRSITSTIVAGFRFTNNSKVTAEGDILLEALSIGSVINSLAGAVAGG